MIQNGSPRRRILLDSNVLLLLYVGGFERGRIASFKNTARFSVEDFDVLQHAVRGFAQIVTTAHVLTEVSNLSNQLGEPVRTEYFGFFASQIPLLSDLSVDSSAAARDMAFARLGLTDVAISLVAKEHDLTVLTADVGLWVHLLTLGVDVENFNHIRSSRLIPNS